MIKSLPPRVQKYLPSHFPESMSGFKNHPNSLFSNNNEGATQHVVYKTNNHPFIDAIGNISELNLLIINELTIMQKYIFKLKEELENLFGITCLIFDEIVIDLNELYLTLCILKF